MVQAENNKNNKHDQVGGDVTSTLNGEYQFDLRARMTEAWELTQQSRWVIVQMVLIVVVTGMLVVSLALRWFNVTDPSQIPANVQLGIDLFVTVTFAPFFAAIMLAGANHSVGGRSSLSHLFGQFNQMLPLGLTALMVSLAIQIGLGLFVLPGLYVAMASGFALMLVAEKHMTPARAILLSARVFNRYWVEFLKLHLLYVALGLLVIFTLGIALIWVAPFYYHLKGVLYRDMFGVQVHTHTDTNGNQQESVFHA